MIHSTDIHAHLNTGWPVILAQLGVPDVFLQKTPGPCPGCGGRDRFTFDNRRGRGDYFCRRCGAGDGFKLLELVNGWSFADARRQVIAAAGLADHRVNIPVRHVAHPAPRPAAPTARVHRLRRECCAAQDCGEAVDYLASRGLWPLPKGCSWRAHPSVEYWHENQRIGRYAALVADVTDINGELVTAHVTFLQNGRKLASHEPRKLLSPLTGRIGCAVRLMPATDFLGVSEGIETALSAAILHRMPVWAALNTALLARFAPPATVKHLNIFADRDEPGLTAATRAMENLQQRVHCALHTPEAGDWNDVLLGRHIHE